VRLFGTNGIREVVGEKLTASFVTSVAGGIAALVPPGKPIVVGWDGRTSSPHLARLVSGTLALGGHRVIELGLLPTPAIQYNLLQLNAQLGVILTASHNPPEFNGIKLIAEDGLEVTRDVEAEVEGHVARGQIRTVPFDRVGEVRTDHLGAERYISGILKLVNAQRIGARNFHLILDCGNGASAVTSPTLLRRLNCRLVTLNAQVDGTFPGHLSEPTEAHLAELCGMVPASGAELGIAHDGDADRAVFVDAEGHFVPGEQILTLLAWDAVRANGGGVVVTPVSGSQAIEDAVKPLGGEVVYTRVGSPVVTREMARRSAIFGGEENGGLVFPKFQLARDGAMTAAAVLDLLAREDASLAELLRRIPRYSLVKEKVPCSADLLTPVLEGLQAELETENRQLVTLDGLKVYYDGGWVLLRPSGTEPLIRVFAEAKSADTATALARRGVEQVKSIMARLQGQSS
jgi:phosphomannomutase / phosphoglucomutase